MTESWLLRHFSIMETFFFFFSDHIVIDLGIQVMLVMVMIGLGYRYSFRRPPEMGLGRTSEMYGIFKQ